MSLPPPLDGEFFVAGGIACWTAGSGPPLLLVHSVNATASAAEVRPLFEHARRSRTVFAIELPGYGHSDRSDRDYTPRVMTDALHAVAARIRQRCGPGPIDALAVSLTCEYLARAAVEQPQHWRRLALVSPTGFNGRKVRRAAPGSTRVVPWLYRLLSNPRWAQWLFDQLTRPGVVRYFLERTWGGKAIDETMWAYALLTARQPGARFAPLHFLGGGLFSADIHSVYDAITQPVWASHGVRGDFTDYRGMALVDNCARWQLSVYPTGALPYFEVPAEFNAAFDTFFS